MGKHLVKGEKINISKISDYYNKFTIDITNKVNNEISFDIDIFLCMCEVNNRINKKKIIFYNNPENSGENIRFEDFFTDDIENKKVFQIDLNSVEKDIYKLIIGYSVYKNKKNIDKHGTTNITIKFINSTMQAEIFTMDIHENIINNNSGVIGEIYRYKDFWKFNAIEHISKEGLIATIRDLFDVEFY
ncbi:MAG: hypothetical protein A2Y24_04815 [Clostridiales bacterium GWE2_32_10]|nr:MAG: hypothetical protein A2Y24_04815 [Clostridiales bacterium GWE2_32_10]